MPDPYVPPSPGAPRGSARRLKLIGLVLAVAAVVVVAVGLFNRVSAGRRLAAQAKADAVQTVRLAKIEGGGERTLVLPGELQAESTAEIHARVGGYLKRWYVDIGAPVKAGQVLAEIDTPELDQQVAQARADLSTARANETLSRKTSQRWAELLAKGFVSPQAADEKAGDLAAKSAIANSAQANLNRLTAMQGFKRITAPFAGVVTARGTDVGALVTAGGGEPLFSIADPRRLRIYVRVPQTYSGLLARGAAADVTAPEYPGETFPATVTADAQAVGAQTGAILMELQLDNAAGRLTSGAYAQVAFKLPATSAVARLPATALQFRRNGPVVAVAGPDGRVQVHPVTIARDLGSSVEISAGIAPTDRVIDNPPESLAAGDPVRIVTAARNTGG